MTLFRSDQTADQQKIITFNSFKQCMKVVGVLGAFTNALLVPILLRFMNTSGDISLNVMFIGNFNIFLAIFMFC